MREAPSERGVGVVNPLWERAWPWLVHGVTTRTSPVEGADFRLFGADGAPARGPASVRSWRGLVTATGFGAAVVARQVHGCEVRLAPPECEERAGLAAGTPELLLAPPCDGHATREAGLLLAVTVADCVPVLMVHPGRRVVAVVHAGWRGVAAGVLERGLEVLARALGAPAGEVHVHLGPAICGRCYEVGPEVFEALGLEAPPGPACLDLRDVLVRRALAAGVAPGHLSMSERCTRCERAVFYSHRGGAAARQVAFVGVLP